MFIKKVKIALIYCVFFTIFACSSNPNSTLNHSPKDAAKYTPSKNTENKTDKPLVIDKDYGKGDKDIVIFSTNDTLSSFNDNLGIASIKYYVEHFDKEHNFTTLVDTGNFSAGTELADKTHGDSSIKIMNKVGYDILVPGSLDFKYGLNKFFENMSKLKSHIVCCNLYDTKKKAFPFLPYVIYKYNDLKIAFVGVTSPEALILRETYDKFYNENGEQLIYFFEDDTGDSLYKQVQLAVDTAKSEGADKVILLAHLGIEGITERWSTTKVIANTKDIDGVIDGHSMEVLDNGLMINKVGQFIPMVQAGSKCKYLGALNITNEDYIYPAVMKDRSVNKKDMEFQKYVDEVFEEKK